MYPNNFKPVQSATRLEGLQSTANGRCIICKWPLLFTVILLHKRIFIRWWLYDWEFEQLKVQVNASSDLSLRYGGSNHLECLEKIPNNQPENWKNPPPMMLHNPSRSNIGSAWSEHAGLKPDELKVSDHCQITFTFTWRSQFCWKGNTKRCFWLLWLFFSPEIIETLCDCYNVNVSYN